MRIALLLLICAWTGLACASAKKKPPRKSPPRTTTGVKPKPAPKPAPSAPRPKEFRLRVVDYAQKFVGTPYRYAGVTPQTGFDCSGFTAYVMRHFNIKISNSSAAQATEGREVRLNAVQPGDLVIFYDGQRVQHVGLVTRREANGDIFCVHSSSSRGVIVENMSQSSYWRPRMGMARDVITGAVRQ